MNTSELADAVAETNDIAKAKAKEVVNSILVAILDAAKRGEKVAIAEFGRLSVKLPQKDFCLYVGKPADGEESRASGEAPNCISFAPDRGIQLAVS